MKDLTLEMYTRAVREGWPEDDIGRAMLHDLPRSFHALTRERQAAVIATPPPLTGTRWDALLAAVAEHLATLHEHPVQAWMDEPERFLDNTWVLADPEMEDIRHRALVFSPPAFIRHGAIPDPRELDARGGERHAWCPE